MEKVGFKDLTFYFGQLISNKVGGKVGAKFKKIQKNALLDKKTTLILNWTPKVGQFINNF